MQIYRVLIACIYTYVGTCDPVNAINFYGKSKIQHQQKNREMLIVFETDMWLLYNCIVQSWSHNLVYLITASALSLESFIFFQQISIVRNFLNNLTTAKRYLGMITFVVYTLGHTM